MNLNYFLKSPVVAAIAINLGSLIPVEGLIVRAFAATESSDFDTQMQVALATYLTIQESLASDNLEAAIAAAKKLSGTTASLTTPPTLKGVKELDGFAGSSGKIATDLAAAKNINSAREKFKELSKPFVAWVKIAKPKNVAVMFCPMADSHWAQTAGAVRNPFYGKAMLDCGSVVR